MNAHDRHVKPAPGTPQQPPGAAASADSYLWNRHGPVDAEVASLEHALATLRYRPPAASSNQPSHLARTTILQQPVAWRAAAALVLFICGAWAMSLISTALSDSGATRSLRNALAGAGGLVVAVINGTPRVEGAVFEREAVLRTGQWLETDSRSTAEISVGSLGTVQVEPVSRLRLVRSQPNEQRLELAGGAITAFITAPPRLFMVDTPAATAVDLGCAYRLNVDDDGRGLVEVTLGWVSMETTGSESIVPRGAMCLTRKGAGAGTPFYADASAALRRALEQFDFDDGGVEALRDVLAEARPRDSLTLWHVLARSSGEARRLVADRLWTLAPPPESVRREAIMRGDPIALHAWRDALPWSPTPPLSAIQSPVQRDEP